MPRNNLKSEHYEIFSVVMPHNNLKNEHYEIFLIVMPHNNLKNEHNEIFLIVMPHNNLASARMNIFSPRTLLTRSKKGFIEIKTHSVSSHASTLTPSRLPFTNPSGFSTLAKIIELPKS